MKVNTVCLSLDRYEDLISTKREYEIKFEEYQQKFAAIENLIVEDLKNRIRNKDKGFKVACANVDSDKLAVILGNDFHEMVEFVEKLVSANTDNGYQE